MKLLKTPRAFTLKNKEQLKGYVFLIPLIFGLVMFFIIPVFKSFLFSISEVTSGSDGYLINISGFSAYYSALFEHTSYRQTVVSAVTDMITVTPLIILFSFFMASVLNQNFKGRVIFRVILFLPVILTVMNSYSNTLENSMGAYNDMSNSFGMVATSFTDSISQMMVNAGLSEEVVESVIGLVDKIYSVIDLSAIQILIMLVGMQSVPPSLYEAATVEGATPWESFWKITVPMTSSLIFTCVIYTIIDSFTKNNNTVMALMSETAFNKLNFSLASAMGWIYFALIGILLCVVTLLSKRMIFSYNN